MNKNGLFIVIEGVDGSGKGTQSKILAEALAAQGYPVESVDFPRYDEPSSYFVREYLNGNYGTLDDVGPYTGSLFYALDRYEASAKIRSALSSGKVVIANRYTGSNMAHQGTKFSNAHERRGFFIWLDNLEFEMLKIPRPHLNLVLQIPADVAQANVDKKAARNYTDEKRDLHETDMQHLEKSVEVYRDLCSLFPKDFKPLDCARQGDMLSVKDIQKLIYQTIEPLLPEKTDNGQVGAASDVVELNPYITKEGNEFTITREGMSFLGKAVTNIDSNVYAFTDKLSTLTIAAAMARLSRRGDDMRITLLDEFAFAAEKDKQLLQRVITAYGDDSVQQLVGLHFVVEDASNILTKKLEWGRLAAYLEQSTRYIYYDQKDTKGNYKYYTPEYLEPELRDIYKQALDTIFDTYSRMVRTLTEFVRNKSDVPEQERDVAWKGATRAQACDAARPVLPVATKSTVGIFASGQALESLIMHLLSDELPEAHATGRKLLIEARKVLSTFLERVDVSGRGVAMQGYKAFTHQAVKGMAEKHLPNHYSAQSDSVMLTDYWPKNELHIVADMLYEHSQLSLQEIRKHVEVLDYDKKVEIFNSYIGERYNRRHKPGRAMEKPRYSWDILCDYGIFRDLQRHRMVDDMQWQLLTPRFGFEAPALIEEVGLTDMYEECFDLSMKLYDLMIKKGYTQEAQYTTLLGHKMRWKVTYNAREAFHLHELRTSPQGHPGYRKLVNEMHEKLREVHPLVADAMKFVNKGEDPELTRLAAERYSQNKLNKL